LNARFEDPGTAEAAARSGGMGYPPAWPVQAELWEGVDKQARLA